MSKHHPPKGIVIPLVNLVMDNMIFGDFYQNSSHRSLIPAHSQSIHYADNHFTLYLK